MIVIENYKSGHTEQNMGYTYFVPNFVNEEWEWNTPIVNQLLEKAAIKLGELNSFSRLVPNIDLFIHLHVTKEAVVLSRIEGTQTNMNEALMPMNEVLPEKRDDWKEVNNYICAIDDAVKSLKDLPISFRLIKMTHKTLLESVRGEHKMPGEYRTSQNWIGGNSLADAKYIPPQHQLVNDLMSDLEKFLNNEQLNVPALIKIAIAHYQFETIHPFLDGNGRIGRLLITLFLVKERILNQPLLYLSTYFEKNKALYYDNLSNVRLQNGMLQWIKYFLVGIEQTATQAVETLSEILKLKEDIETDIRSRYGRRSTSAILLIHRLFENPFIKVDDAAKICNVTYKAANDLVKKMHSDNFLLETTGHSRNRMYVFDRYLQFFDKNEH